MSARETFKTMVERGDAQGAAAFAVANGLRVRREDFPTLAQRDRFATNPTLAGVFDTIHGRRVQEEEKALQDAALPEPLTPGESLTPLQDFAATLPPLQRFYYERDRALDIDAERQQAALFKGRRLAVIEAQTNDCRAAFDATTDAGERARLLEQVAALEAERANLTGGSNV